MKLNQICRKRSAYTACQYLLLIKLYCVYVYVYLQFMTKLYTGSILTLLLVKYFLFGFLDILLLLFASFHK